MDKLPFTHNWNGKLFLDNFGTVRLYNEEKYFVGNKLDVELKQNYMGTVEVVAVRKFRFDQITNALSYLDTGKPSHYMAELIKKFYGHKMKITNDMLLHHVVCHYTQRNLPVHAALLKDWWQSQLEKQPMAIQQEIF